MTFSKMTKTIASAIALISGATALPNLALAQRSAPVLEPSTNWNLEYANRSCVLSRDFGTGDALIRYEITQSFGFRNFDVLLVGPGLPKLGKRPSLSVESGSPATLQKVRSAFASTQGSNIKGLRFYDGAKIALQPSKDEQFFVVKQKGRDIIKLRVGPTGRLVAATQKCVDDLMGEFGVDMTAFRSLAKPPEVKGNSDTWVSVLDYPEKALRDGEEGRVNILLEVDAAGKPGDCTVIETSGNELLDEKACATLKRRARFEPALDDQGQSTASIWTSVVDWSIP